MFLLPRPLREYMRGSQAPRVLQKRTTRRIRPKQRQHRHELFPNPAHNILYISLGEHFSYRIFNEIGRQIASGESAGAMQLQCSGMAQGVYFIQIRNNDAIITKKFVIQ